MKSSYIIIANLKIVKTDNEPLYKQLYKQLRDQILTGQLKAGQKLPSTRMIAEQLCISRNVAVTAYEQLVLEGYIVSVKNSGTIVSKELNNLLYFNKNGIASKVLLPAHSNKVSLTFLKGVKTLPFQHSAPSLDAFPYSAWVKCAHRMLKYLEFLELGYGNEQGFLPLREEIATYLRTNRGLRCEADQIVITTGVQQSLNIIGKALIKKNNFFWMEDPGYKSAKEILCTFGAKPCYIPLKKNGLDIDWAIKTFPKAKLAYVTPSNQFPHGGTLSLDKRVKLLNWANRSDMWIIEDDYDSEFRYHKKIIPALQGLDNNGRVIYLGSFNKIIFPALRIGYIVLPNLALAGCFVFEKKMLDRQNAMADQVTLFEFMNGGYFYRHLKKVRVLYLNRYNTLLSVLNKHGKDVLLAEKQDGGMHIVAWLIGAVDERTIVDKLAKEKIMVTPISTYSFKYKQRPGLLLGYTGFPEKTIYKVALKMIEIIRKVSL